MSSEFCLLLKKLDIELESNIEDKIQWKLTRNGVFFGKIPIEQIK